MSLIKFSLVYYRNFVGNQYINVQGNYYGFTLATNRKNKSMYLVRTLRKVTGSIPFKRP